MAQERRGKPSNNVGRREFLRSVGIGATALTATRMTHAMNATPERRPNILFIHTDSWDGRALGFMGHPGRQRRAVDRAG